MRINSHWSNKDEYLQTCTQLLFKFENWRSRRANVYYQNQTTLRPEPLDSKTILARTQANFLVFIKFRSSANL